MQAFEPAQHGHQAAVRPALAQPVTPQEDPEYWEGVRASLSPWVRAEVLDMRKSQAAGCVEHVTSDGSSGRNGSACPCLTGSIDAA